jgi:hypothetical protein
MAGYFIQLLNMKEFLHHTLNCIISLKQRITNLIYQKKLCPLSYLHIFPLPNGCDRHA